MAVVLIIEDEPVLAKNVATFLVRHGHDASIAPSGEAGLDVMETLRPDVVLLDYALPGLDGLAVLKQLKSIDARIPVVMMTGQGSELVAVDAMKSGAVDYLIKPVVLGELRIRLDKLLGQQKLEQELSYLRRRGEGRLDQLVGTSAPMIALKDAIRRLLAAETRLADAQLPAVLVTGETGTGKEVVARAVHFDGARSAAPFVELNCSTLPGELLEAELFGYERGAFTDAKQRKLGLVEAAAGGTLFLDEIGDIEPRLQVKLLKLLEDRTVRRLGSVREQRTDIRVVAATNRNLDQAVREGAFRSDLLFRLRIIHFDMPPLRARGGDIMLLARHFLALHGRRYGKPRVDFTPAAERALLAHAWPGNVRELRNLVEQAVILAAGDTLDVADLRLAAAPQGPVAGDDAAISPGVEDAHALNLASAERDLLERALAQSGGNVSHAARLLGVSRDTMRYRMEKHGLKAAP